MHFGSIFNPKKQLELQILSHRYIETENVLPFFFLATGGCTTTCMVIAPQGRSPMVILEQASVLLSSKILPACTCPQALHIYTFFGYVKKVKKKTRDSSIHVLHRCDSFFFFFFLLELNKGGYEHPVRSKISQHMFFNSISLNKTQGFS